MGTPRPHREEVLNGMTDCHPVPVRRTRMRHTGASV